MRYIFLLQKLHFFSITLFIEQTTIFRSYKMDSTAASMCRDNNMPILVFGLSDPENIVRAVKGEKIGTLVNNEGKL